METVEGGLVEVSPGIYKFADAQGTWFANIAAKTQRCPQTTVRQRISTDAFSWQETGPPGQVLGKGKHPDPV